ncbi:MAG: hypothetical protein IJU68_00025 [Bacteroidales bacterium]|nr:hypothetical protein [Bacteroidales bacterium]
MSFKKFFLLLITIVALFISCDIFPNKDDFGGIDQSDQIYEFLSVDASSQLSSEERKNVESINNFAFNSSIKINASTINDSFVYSPMSMALLLGMIAEGAKGETRDEILSALNLNGQDQDSINVFSRNLLCLSTAASSDEEIFEIANCAVVDKSIKVSNEYKKNAKNYYDAEIVSKDFIHDDIVLYINTWAYLKTHKRINSIISNVDSSTKAVFLNALYFKAAWLDSFSLQSSYSESFTKTDGAIIQEIMMHRLGDISYYESSDFTMVNLPYGYHDNFKEQSSNYSMSLVLPHQSLDINGLLGKLSESSLSSLLSKLTKHKVRLTVPRFDIYSDLDYTSLLKSLGIRHLFNEADLSSMADDHIQIERIKQVANISIDEQGTEAVAVSFTDISTDPEDTIEPPKYLEFTCNRPFIFIITERKTNAILFIGAIK